MTTTAETTQRCTKCGEEKPLSEFSFDKKLRNGHCSWCKRCKSAATKQWSAEHKERRASRSEQVREYNRKYRQEHAAEVRQASKKWRAEHPEQYREITRGVDAHRRARKLGAEGRHTMREWRAVLARYDSRCLACGATEHIQQDHVVPLVLGGSDYIDNIQPLCRRCNARKQSRYRDYRPGSYWADWT